MDKLTRGRVAGILVGATCRAATSTREDEDGVLHLAFDGALLEVTSQWATLRNGVPIPIPDALSCVVGSGVANVSVDERDHKLRLEFTGGETIYATPDSDVYESWILETDSGEIIGAGPGLSWFAFAPSSDIPAR